MQRGGWERNARCLGCRSIKTRQSAAQSQEVEDAELQGKLAIAYITKYKREAKPESAEEAINMLDQEDIDKIQGLMQKATLGEIVHQHVKEKAKEKAPIQFFPEGIEEAEKAPADILSRDLTGSDIKGLFPGIENLFDHTGRPDKSR